MAEVMAETQESKGINRTGRSTTKQDKPAEGSTPKETPEPGNNDGDAAAEADRAIQQEQLKAQRDPAKVVSALRNVVRIAIAHDLKGLVLRMIETAKNGNTIAMKLLLDLCRVVDPDGVADGSSGGFGFADLFGPEFDWKSAMESENLAASERAEASVVAGSGAHEPD